LPVQIVILTIQGVIVRDVWHGQGFFAKPRPRTGGALQAFACGYAVSMVVRYGMTRSHPIPIVFHEVLSTYLFTLGRFMRCARGLFGGGGRCTREP